MKNSSNLKILFKQTLKDEEDLSGDVAGPDMSSDEFKELRREAWKDEGYRYFHLQIENEK